MVPAQPFGRNISTGREKRRDIAIHSEVHLRVGTWESNPVEFTTSTSTSSVRVLGSIASAVQNQRALEAAAYQQLRQR